MTKAEVAEEVRRHMKRWARHMVRQHATPYLALAVGQDHADGRLVVCSASNVDKADLVEALRDAADQLELTEGV